MTHETIDTLLTAVGLGLFPVTLLLLVWSLKFRKSCAATKVVPVKGDRGPNADEHYYKVVIKGQSHLFTKEALNDAQARGMKYTETLNCKH